MSVKLASKKRLLWVALFTLGLFGLLIIQFYKIQIVEGDRWTREARAQHQLLLTEPFKRGLFYANTSIKAGHPKNAQPLVIDVPKFHLFVDPESIPASSRDLVAQKIAQSLHLGPEEQKKVRMQLDKKSRCRKIAMWVERPIYDQVQEWWRKYAKEKKIALNALYFVQDYQRSYPFGKLLGQVLHTVREDREGKTKQNIPTGGLELIFNEYLKGKEGKRLLMRSPRHPLDAGKVIAYPENGADVYLTINPYLQAMAEEEIEKAVKKANAKGGWAILMQPRTGEVWALAQYPSFDPSHYREFFNDEAKKEDTKVKAITDPYEPGSTMKPLTLAICLKANYELQKLGKKPIFSPEEKVATSNGQFPGRKKPISDLHPHRYLNMNLGLQKSSNIYMARMIQRVIDSLGEDWYRSCLQNIFGFGLKTGIELPAESAGLLPTPGKKHPNGALEWSTPTPFSLSFGHNILVSSLQMLRSYAVIANGGFDVQPTLLKKVVKTSREGTQELLLDNTKEERVQNFKRLLEPEIVDAVTQAMKYVTKPGGTAPKGDIFGYSEAGKTSTTEKIVKGSYSKKDHISTFVGFAPAKNAEFVLLIAIDDPEFRYIPGVGKNQQGGNCAAPAFREIGTRTLQYLGVEPDDPFGYPVGDPRHDGERADWMRETRRLKELYLKWNE